MKSQQISAVCRADFAVAVTAAVAQIRNWIRAKSPPAWRVSATRRARPDRRADAPGGVGQYPQLSGSIPPHPLTFPQLANLAQFTVEINFDFNSAAIRPESYRTVGAIADALHNPILLGYGFLVIGHTDSVGGRAYNVGLSQRRAEAIVGCVDRSLRRQSGDTAAGRHGRRAIARSGAPDLGGQPARSAHQCRQEILLRPLRRAILCASEAPCGLDLMRSALRHGRR